MKRRVTATVLLACLAAAALVLGSRPGPAEATRAPGNFFGIAPQTLLTPEDAAYMKAGGIDSVRLTLPWSAIQPTPRNEFNWGAFDPQLEIAARAGLEVLPTVGAPPRWVIHNSKRIPVANARQRRALTVFLRAAAKRYGPGGEFWSEHAHEGINYEPAIGQPVPIRSWQIYNEPNFFYFIYPVNPAPFAKLITVASKAIKSVQPGAKIVLGGLFAEPTAGGKRGMSATTYLRRLYAIPGFKNRFDGIDLHPYAIDSAELERMVEAFHDVAVENNDHPGLYITEMGWGSQNNFQHDAFEQGPGGQVKQLRNSYRYLLGNRNRLNLKQVYWFTWKDTQGSCDFCDSTGLFHEGERFHPKPAWRTFVSLTGGRVRP
jgi:polysaccharide biosynthesis protein PslG